MLDLTLHVLLAYLLGSISGSLLIGRLRRVDIRTLGSGNAGGTNAFRTQGFAFALMVVLIDMGKGALATAWLPSFTLAAPAADPHWLTASCAMAAVAGHIWPVYHGFRGGKGAATAVGASAAINPAIILILLPIWLSLLIGTGYVGLATICATLSLWPGLWLLSESPLPTAYSVASIVITLLIINAHRSNIQRLRQGNENRFDKARLFHRRRHQQP
ncbi:MAG: glycerol-3-phosphate 1-O-acyltransferase PlsY [Wenzhouxiangellaceae bacterium]